MKLNPEPTTDMKILLRLYEVKQGTLLSISKEIGIGHTSGKIYTIKDDLLKLGILTPIGSETVKIGMGEKQAIVYKVNHDVIDQIFLGELETSILFFRVRDRIDVRKVLFGFKKNGLLSK